MGECIYVVYIQPVPSYEGDKILLGYVNSHEEFIALYGSADSTPIMGEFGRDSIHYEVVQDEKRGYFSNFVATPLEKLVQK